MPTATPIAGQSVVIRPAQPPRTARLAAAVMTLGGFLSTGAALAQAPPPEAADLAREFPDGTYLLATEHFFIVHDTTYAWAENRANLLRRAHDRFYQSMTAAGFEPQPLDRRLVCVMFDQFDTFSRYARRVDRRNVDWAGGYYSGRTNRITLYNYLNSPKLAEQAERVNRLQSDIRAMRAQLASARGRRDAAGARATRIQLARAQRELRSIRRRYEVGGGLSNIANTFHEAAHMLAFNSGIQKRANAYPLWFSEGLATSFETVAPAAPFGPGHDNPLRQPALVKAIGAQKLIPLEDLVAMTQLPDTAGEDEDEANRKRTVFYAQSWGLFHYLFTQRRADLVRYNRTLNAQPPGRRHETRLRREFITAFGEIGDVEQAMIRHHLNKR